MFTDTEVHELYQDLTSVLPLDLGSKVADTRSERPAWAASQHSIALHIIGASKLRRVQVALMYWRMNWTAQEIADHLGVSVGSIKQIIFRMAHKTVTIQDS